MRWRGGPLPSPELRRSLGEFAVGWVGLFPSDSCEATAWARLAVLRSKLSAYPQGSGHCSTSWVEAQPGERDCAAAGSAALGGDCSGSAGASIPSSRCQDSGSPWRHDSLLALQRTREKTSKTATETTLDARVTHKARVVASLLLCRVPFVSRPITNEHEHTNTRTVSLSLMFTSTLFSLVLQVSLREIKLLPCFVTHVIFA